MISPKPQLGTKLWMKQVIQPTLWFHTTFWCDKYLKQEQNPWKFLKVVTMVVSSCPEVTTRGAV